MVPLINKFFEGTVTFSDLWAQFGDHRMFFPKIIWLMLIEVSSWNTFYETSLNILLFVVLCIIILVQIRQSLSLIGKGSVWLFFPIVSLIMFSTKNWENWLCGLQITYSLNFLCAVSGLLLLCEPRHKISCLVGSFLLGFVATHSFSFGLAYWPVGFIPLIFWRGANRPLRRWFLLAWAVFSVIGYLSFFYGYSRATDPAHSKFYADRLYDVVLFTLSLFGSPLGRLFDVIHFPGNRTFLGFFIFFILFCLSVFVISRFTRERLAIILPFLCIILYAFLSALLIAVGRSGIGIEPAFWVRYSTLADLAWLSLTILMVMAILILFSASRTVSKVPIVLIPLFLTVCFCYLSSVSLDSINGVSHFKRHHHALQESSVALICSEESDKMLPLLPWSIEVLQKQAEVLKRLKLSVYANSSETRREEICSERATR